MRLIDAEYLLYGMGMFSERENGAEFMKGAEAVAKMIEEAETVHEPDDWTPCAEGLPDTNDDVYITYEYRGKLIAAIGFMGHSGAWYILEDDDGNEAKVNVIAWQPLPDPYRGDHIPDAKGETDGAEK